MGRRAACLALLVAAGCGATATAPPRAAHRTCLRAPGQQYVYNELVHIPRHMPRRPAVVVAFHGLHEPPSTLESDTKLNAIADRHGFVVGYPSAQRGTLRWQLTKREGDEDIDYVRTFIRLLVQRTCADPRRVYLTGFSNGAGFAWRAGCDLADRVAAIAPVSGSYRSQDPCPAGTRPMPTLEIHGRDPWTATTARLIHDTTRRNGCTRSPRTRRVAPGVTRTLWPGCNLQRIYNRRIHHQWLSRGAYDTSTEVWNFVRRFSTTGS